MDRLFCTVQNLMSMGYSVWFQARTVDERTIHITVHFQTGESANGMIGEDNVRTFVSARCACDFLHRVFAPVLCKEVRHEKAR